MASRNTLDCARRAHELKQLLGVSTCGSSCTEDGAIVAVLGFVLQGTNAFGGGASGWYAGFGNGMWSYAGFGGPGGWGAPGFGYTGNGWSLSAARPNTKASSSTRTAADSMTLTVTVPADAKLFVNGHATTSIGETRQYSSAGLRPGSKYDYQVRTDLFVMAER